MTKKEFKSAMLCGLGRAVTAVIEEPEKYRSLVLWACNKNISYDAQCEGTRASYVYKMASCYPDKETFISAAAEALNKYRSNSSWDLLHLCELLSCFASDGYDSARKALRDKYNQLLADMQRRNRRPNRIFYEMGDLEQMGIVLAENRKAFLKIVKDFGRLYRSKKYMIDGEFPWFFTSKCAQYKRTLEKAARYDEDVACFLKREQAGEEIRNSGGTPPHEKSDYMLHRQIAKNADDKTLKEYAQKYRDEVRPELRAKALEVFIWSLYPDDPQPIINDTQSSCDTLRKTAWWALEKLRHPAVRSFALTNAASGINTAENFSLLITNYTPKDANLIEKTLREIISKENKDDIHAAGMDVLRAFHKGSDIPHPKHLLPYIYQSTPCSCCRESIVACMAKHRMLTNEILRECLYDSSFEIRSYAEKKLKQKK